MQKREFKLTFDDDNDGGLIDLLKEPLYDCSYVNYFIPKSVGNYTLQPAIYNMADCREDTIENLIEAMSAGQYPSDRARVCVVLTHKKKKVEREKFDRWMEQGENILHAVETKLRWRKTRVHKIKDFPSTSIYYFLGSSKWLMSTHTFSLYLLLMRLGVKHRNVTVWEDLEKINKRGSWNEYSARDTFECWLKFLRNLDKIYKGYKPGEHMMEMNDGHSTADACCDGIQTLYEGTSVDDDVQRAFDKIVREKK